MLTALGVLVAFMVGSFFVAAFLAFTAVFSPRLGAAPYCKSCGYELTGNVSGRCPECGGSARNAVSGKRAVRRRRFAVAGCLFALDLTLLGVVAHTRVSGTNRYPVVPTSWLLRDIRIADAGCAQQAMSEIRRRLAGERLSAKDESRLVEIALAEQVRASPRPNLSQSLFDFLDTAYAKGILTEDQSRRLFENVAKVKVVMQPKVPINHPYKFDLAFIECRCPTGWWCFVYPADVRCDRPFVWNNATDLYEITFRTPGIHTFYIDVACLIEKQDGSGKVIRLPTPIQTLTCTVEAIDANLEELITLEPIP